MTSRTRNWALALAGAVLYATGQAVNLSERLPRIPWLELFLFELPVWFSVVAVSPLVFWVARRMPLFGDNAKRNFAGHIVAACGIIFLQCLLVETTRRFVIKPVVIGSGLAFNNASLEYAGIPDRMSVMGHALLAFRYYVLFFFFVYFTIAVVYYGANYHRELLSARLRTQELQTSLAKSQLDSLRLQLHPHFLFNTLNTVSSLMSRDVALARRTLARLSDLLRETLSDTAVHEVTLANELKFLDAYLEIQRARFGSRLQLEKRVDESATNLLVPHMLLQPLVENSIHHGMRDGDQPLCICVEAIASATSLKLTVTDDGFGLRGRKLKERVGLRNARERLERLYGVDQTMDVTSPTNGGFSVLLVIPARSANQTAKERNQREIA